MKKTKFFILMIGVTIISQSCNIMYRPNMQNVPLLSEKNEVRATIGPTDFQGAFAVTDNLGIMVNGSLVNGQTQSNFDNFNSNYTTQVSKGSLIEAGVGYYKPLNENALFEVYGGVGAGKNSIVSSEFSNGISFVNSSIYANSSRFFVQPSIGFSNDYVDFAFSTRFVLQKYSKIDTLGYTTTMLYNDDLLNIDQPIFAFLEPALTLRIGYKYVKFHAQAMYSYKYNSEPLNYFPVNVNVGIHINIAGRFNAKAPKGKASLD
ncbi:MAG: hypothetical protein WCP69_06225 [Bacteroidota bacterium]